MSKPIKDISVLVVEDEEALNKAYVKIIESNKMVVKSTSNGAEAFETLATFNPDVILLDLRMPKMSGIKFLELYNQLKPKRKSKIIIFSNYDKQEEIEQAFSLGANKYLLKSWASPKELVKLIKDSL